MCEGQLAWCCTYPLVLVAQAPVTEPAVVDVATCALHLEHQVSATKYLVLVLVVVDDVVDGLEDVSSILVELVVVIALLELQHTLMVHESTMLLWSLN